MSSGGPASGGGNRRISNQVSAASTSVVIEAMASSMPARRKPEATIKRWRITARLSGRAPADDAEDRHDEADRADDARYLSHDLHHGGRIIGAAGHRYHAGEKHQRQDDQREAGNHQPP